MRPTKQRFGTLLLATLMLLVSGCGGSRPDDDSILAWREVASSGLGDARAAVFLSTPMTSGTGQRGYVALVDAAGATRFVETGALDNGETYARGGTLCAASSTQTFRFSATGATRSTRGGMQASGHWAGQRADGSCVLVFNSGVSAQGYRTDVYWDRGGTPLHAVVPDVPGPTGLSEDALWVSNAGTSSTNDGLVTLYRVDLDTAKVTVSLRWRSGEDDGARQPSAQFVADSSSDLVELDGSLYYLAQIQGADVPGPRPEFAPGMTHQLRLVELQPAERRVRSTRLLDLKTDLSEDESGDASPVAAAFASGVLTEDTIYTADAAGRLLAVDLATKRLRVVNRLSDAAIGAREVIADQSGGALALLLFARDGRVLWETYDIGSAELTDVRRVPDLEDLTKDGELIAYSFSLRD